MLLKDFYTLVDTTRKEDGKFVTQIKINKDHEVYKGHFPGRPVTPGVILMHLFKEEAERISNCKLQLVKGNNVKFIAVVDPNVNAHLILESEITAKEDDVKLKGLAKTSSGISLKINSLYKRV